MRPEVGWRGVPCLERSGLCAVPARLRGPEPATRRGARGARKAGGRCPPALFGGCPLPPGAPGSDLPPPYEFGRAGGHGAREEGREGVGRGGCPDLGTRRDAPLPSAGPSGGTSWPPAALRTPPARPLSSPRASPPRRGAGGGVAAGLGCRDPRGALRVRGWSRPAAVQPLRARPSSPLSGPAMGPPWALLWAALLLGSQWGARGFERASAELGSAGGAGSRREGPAGPGLPAQAERRRGGPRVVPHEYMLALYRTYSAAQKLGANASVFPSSRAANTVSSFVDRGLGKWPRGPQPVPSRILGRRWTRRGVAAESRGASSSRAFFPPFWARLSPARPGGCRSDQGAQLVPFTLAFFPFFLFGFSLGGLVPFAERSAVPPRQPPAWIGRAVEKP